MLKIIDIYSGDKNLNIAKIKSQIDGIIIKATEGVTYQSPTFNQQIKDALNNGVLIGCYHFARSNNAISEAKNFLNTIKPYIGRALLALDVEGQAINNGVKWVKTFLDYIYNETGVRPLLYLQQSFINDSWSPIANSDYDLWVARYRSKNHNYFGDFDSGVNPAPWPYIAIWQFSENGKLQGAENLSLDLNYAYMTSDAWLKYTQSNIRNTPTDILENDKYRVTIETK